MRTNLFIITLLFTGLVACKSKSAFNYSQDIVAKERSLTNDFTSSRAKIDKFTTDNKYDSIIATSAGMEKLIQQKIDEIDVMPVPKAKEVDSFKAATLRYFKYLKSIFTGYNAFGSAKTDDERQKEVTRLQSVFDDSQNVLTDFQAAQKKYAEANGFRLEKQVQ